jgi:AcrR family transcriptional regulator
MAEAVDREKRRARARSRPRARRSHAERTAQTRALLIGAVVESIAEVGLARTTAPEIARRAGVTWGAVQHHFGGKQGMLVCVLDDSFRRFAEALAGIPREDTSLEKRVSHFVDRAWEHFSSAHYRSTHEILTHVLGREGTRARREWRDRMSRDWDRIWRDLFPDARLPTRRHFVLQHFTISALSGLASTLMLEGGMPALRPAVLELVKQTLVLELARGVRGAAQ